LDGDDVHTFGKDAKGEESLRTCDMGKKEVKKEDIKNGKEHHLNKKGEW